MPAIGLYLNKKAEYTRKYVKYREIATTQPTTQNDLKQLLFEWYYYRLKKPTPHKDWLQLGQF